MAGRTSSIQPDIPRPERAKQDPKVKLTTPILVIILLAGLTLTGKAILHYNQDCVASTRIDSYCSGNTQVKPYCNSDGKVRWNTSDCGFCINGVCLPEKCAESGRECGGVKRGVEWSCSGGGEYITTTFVCGRDELCEGDECVESSFNEEWALGEWSRYDEAVSASSEMNFLACGGVFDCDTLPVSLVAGSIIQEHRPSTPREYVDAVAAEVQDLIDYRLDGGEAQCGEKASELLNRHLLGQTLTGNCVDYSTVMIALLRQQNIPAKQVAGCVSRNSYCLKFSIIPDKPLAGMGVTGDLQAYQEFGHSYVQFWTPEFGYVNADPTIGAGASNCVGYRDVVESSGTNQWCYIPLYEEQCEGG